jgi:hypothetical protein
VNENSTAKHVELREFSSHQQGFFRAYCIETCPA